MDINADAYLNKLERIVRELEDIEIDYYNMQNEIIEAKLKLSLIEAILRSGKIDGKNEQIRDAQLLEYTQSLQIKITQKHIMESPPWLQIRGQFVEI